jgi:hypothetical protein
MGSGTISMGLFLGPRLAERYDGAMSFHIDSTNGSGIVVNFLYKLDTQGLRIEYVPASNLDGVTVIRQASSPLVIYFFKFERPLVEF